jgi:hypothetical protein
MSSEKSTRQKPMLRAAKLMDFIVEPPGQGQRPGLPISQVTGLSGGPARKNIGQLLCELPGSPNSATDIHDVGRATGR